MAKTEAFELAPDRTGIIWDAMMYVPTVAGLAIGASIFWHGSNQGLTYLLFFLACFFFYQGLHRILGRLMILPGSAVGLDIMKQQIVVKLRNGKQVELAKSVRYFADYAGKSFGLTGMDMAGAKRQYVFHKGQFADEAAFKRATTALKVFS